ncbi:MAG: glycosyltransferase [Propionicimonas sp.]
MSVTSFAKRVLVRTGLWPWAKKVAGRLNLDKVPSPGPKPVIRIDPVPPQADFPAARYIFAVGAIPRRYAGRTSSVLTKTKLFSELGVPCEILTMNYSAELDDVTAEIRARGALGENVKIVNLHESFSGMATGPVGDPVAHPVEEPGMEFIKDKDAAVYRYFENGVYRLYKRFDYAGRLLIRDWFNENRGRTQRDEFGLDGRLRRVTYFDLHYNKPRQEVYYRPDGTAYMNKWLVVNPTDLTTDVERITLFDEQERPTKVVRSHVQLIQEYLDRMVGTDRVFLSVESRRTDPETLGYHRPNVKQVYVLHNPHTLPPFNDPRKVRPSYRPLLDQRDEVGAIVFLTNAQRADAEARFGTRKNFRVIPHPVSVPTLDPAITRDPNLVVMLARLDQQKQLDEAIRAFALVVKRVPAARLEIYGRGPDEKALRALISQLGLEASVKLAGYTTNPGEVYQRGAVSLLTSKFEGFGLVLLESLSYGCPVVSYDLKYGPSDIITDAETGFLVRRGDRQSLAEQVVKLLTDTPLREGMSAAGRASVSAFSPAAFTARWASLFRGLDAEGWT